MRISRPCYDKYHRCPGWAGGGLRYPKRDRCDGGYITYLTTEPGGEKIKKLWKWRFNRCPECKVIVLPYMIRWTDWRWIKYRIQRKIGDIKYERSIREKHDSDSQ